MQIKNLNESSLPHAYETVMAQREFLKAPSQFVEPLINIAFQSIAEFLGVVKTEEERVAFVAKDNDDQFCFAAIVEYIPSPSDSNVPGEFTLAFTTDEAELEGCKLYYTNNSIYTSHIKNNAYLEAAMRFKVDEHVGKTFNTLYKCIVDWMAENEDTTIKTPKIDFETKIEDGVKYVSLIPSEGLKQAVKAQA